MKSSRRSFLKTSGCGLSAAALAASLERFSAINAFAQNQPNVAGDYKALVCIFLAGGNDGVSTIVPWDDYTVSGGGSTNGYDNVRSGSGLAVPKSALLKITPANTAGVSYGFHPNLSPEANNAAQPKGLLDVWNQGKLAVLCNVGPLLQPITRAQYQANIGHPYQLFSHSDQQTQMQTSVSNTIGQTGWGGRIADIAGSLNGATPLPMNVSIAGNALFGTGAATRQLTIDPGWVPLNSVLQLAMEGGSATDQAARRSAFQQLLGFDLKVVPVNAFSDTTNQALVASAALSSNPSLTTTFPNSYLGYQLLQVARLIKIKDALNMKRQIFFCVLGGFDTHANQTGTSPTSTSSQGSGGSGAQGALLAELSQAMRAFFDELNVQGMSDRVTTFTLSDFGRTLQASGSGVSTVGSDHAWGNQAFIMGGAVSGGKFYGSLRPDGSGLSYGYPALQLGGPDDTDSRGRWIPTTSIEQYAATLAQWFGVAPADFATILPNLNKFSSPNLGFLA